MRTQPPSSPLRKRLPSATAAAAILVTVTAVAFATGLKNPSEEAMAIFSAFVFLTELLDAEMPSGRRLSLSLAPALGLALIGSPALARPLFAAGEVAVAYVAGSLVAMAFRAVTRRDLRVAEFASGFVVVVSATLAYRALYSPSFERMLFGNHGTKASIPGLIAVCGLALLAPAVTETIRALMARRSPAPAPLASAVRSAAPLQLAIVSVAALVALAYPKIGPWSFPLFLAPLAATQFAFRQFANIRSTYVQTVRALARVPEMAGYTQPGHSRRVAELSIEIAGELGAPPEDVLEIEYAALLHDIGRVVLEDPDESGSDSMQRLELALTGASIVEKTGHFPRVSQMIREQYEPYRRRGEDANRTLIDGAKIIKVASAYDDLVRPGVLGHSPWDALERLHLGMAYDYDPAVIQALTRVLEERGAI